MVLNLDRFKYMATTAVVGVTTAATLELTGTSLAETNVAETQFSYIPTLLSRELLGSTT